MNKTFYEAFPDFETFKTGWESSGLDYEVFPTDADLKNQYLTILYNLLLGRYYSSTIAYKDETAFNARLWSIIYQYAPTWWKSVDIQSKLRELTEEEIQKGTSQKSRHGFNPSTIPTGPNASTDNIDTVNDQTLINYQKSKLNAYNDLMLLLKRDVTNEFLNRFKVLFIRIIDIRPCQDESDEE